MLTLKQQIQVLEFFLREQADALAEVTNNLEGEDCNECDNTIRIEDSMCIADIYKQLTGTFKTDDNDVLSWDFDEDTVHDCLQTLDTEYRDGVIESLMEYDDELSVKMYGKTFKQYCEDIDEKFMETDENGKLLQTYCDDNKA